MINQTPALTKTETLNLYGIAYGLTNKQIALVMGKSKETIKAQLHNTFIKLKAEDRTQAVVTALRLGLIDIDNIKVTRSS